MHVTTVTKRYSKSPSDEEKAKCKDLMNKQRKEDEKLRKGIFEFSDANGGWFKFNCRLYPGEISTYSFTHGETCEIPHGIVKLLNNTYRKIRKYDDNYGKDIKPGGAPELPKIFERTARVRFIPLDVM